MENLNLRRITRLAYVVSKAGVPREANVIDNGNLSVERSVIESLEPEMIYRVDLVTKVP
jgi:hypothetical protein